MLLPNLRHQNAKGPNIAKRIQTVREVLYVTFFDKEVPVVQTPVPKGRTGTGNYYRDVVLRKRTKHYKRRRPQTGLKYLRLLHDNAPDLAPVTISCSSN
jgi:hypothetical protein